MMLTSNSPSTALNCATRGSNAHEQMHSLKFFVVTKIIHVKTSNHLSNQVFRYCKTLSQAVVKTLNEQYIYILCGYIQIPPW